MQRLTHTDSILTFGDSITYGYGVRHEQSYPFILSKLSNRKIINAGVNGDTSKDGLLRLDNLLKDDSIKLMLLCFGGNDIIQKKSTHAIKENLSTMIKIAKNKNVEVILISVPNVFLFEPTPLPFYKELSDEEDVKIIENLLSDILSDDSFKNDYIHPNAAGYKEIAEKIYEYLLVNDYLSENP
ncbi:arylesterase [Sulfurimonas aquatica]|uniref:Arylesterase n=1 Tax=Sulfurimonas aquatica TaxID=2672570 RepID=A0A975GE23_9BACT|nr:GDSL-type esterase/lipase family protein [Sulfurimonas aquatica]QSZ42998.1 arylesterase [Sulfurimonas aquatica]